MYKRYHHSNLEQAEATLGHILDIIEDGVWDWNALTGEVIRSPGWYRMLDYDIEALKENVFTWEEIIHPDDYPGVMAHFEAYTQGQIENYRIQYRCKKKDGSYLWIEDSAKIVARTPSGKVARMIGSHTNIHQQKLAQQELEKQNRLLAEDNLSLEGLVEQRTQELSELNQTLYQKIENVQYNATHDVLTGVYNRRCFEERLQKEISRAKRYCHPLCIILIDIDDFKVFNDRYGHKQGDLILQKVAKLLEEHLRETDTVARWGGEEFVIILPETDKLVAIEKAESLRQLIANLRFNKNSKITCSFGVTAFMEGDCADSIFSRTDKALYRAKKLSRNNVQVE
ncbi:sensor domain-containing diguanylate cyclase [Thiomicrorhabdus chilensis]|uniref:sensor domain-containing diguanylate cyclase n=1 Tax=Thiomicrorhabdus chilensis TaxID=63656 RepID=UPI0004190086|nr:sensor domain-containing diguanylate cyclase [Thiomicrorhabdus chilensis]